MKIHVTPQLECFVNGVKVPLAVESARKVYMYENLLIKVDTGWSGHQSSTEVNFYENICLRHDRKYFAKPLAYMLAEQWDMDDPEFITRGYLNVGYIVQELLWFRRGSPSARSRKKVYELAEKYGMSQDVITGGNRRKNWNERYDTGEPVIYDYGIVNELQALDHPTVLKHYIRKAEAGWFDRR